MIFDLPSGYFLQDGNYYWRVRAINGVGAAGKWSTTWQLTIDTMAPTVPLQLSRRLHDLDFQSEIFQMEQVYWRGKL